MGGGNDNKGEVVGPATWKRGAFYHRREVPVNAVKGKQKRKKP